MRNDLIVDGEAMCAVEGVDATHLLGHRVVVDMQRDPQKAAFVRYRLAFRKNEQRPSLSSAIGLVSAYRDFRSAMGLDQQ